MDSVKKAVALSGLLALLAITFGCGPAGPQYGDPVTGKVTFGGANLDFGAVVLQPKAPVKGQRGYHIAVVKDGKYTLSNVLVGEYKVGVTNNAHDVLKLRAFEKMLSGEAKVDPSKMGKNPKKPEPGLRGALDMDHITSLIDPKEDAMMRGKEAAKPIPANLLDPAKSTLPTITVKAGANTHDISIP